MSEPAVQTGVQSAVQSAVLSAFQSAVQSVVLSAVQPAVQLEAQLGGLQRALRLRLQVVAGISVQVNREEPAEAVRLINSKFADVVRYVKECSLD